MQRLSFSIDASWMVDLGLYAKRNVHFQHKLVIRKQWNKNNPSSKSSQLNSWTTSQCFDAFIVMFLGLRDTLDQQVNHCISWICIFVSVSMVSLMVYPIKHKSLYWWCIFLSTMKVIHYFIIPWSRFGSLFPYILSLARASKSYKRQAENSLITSSHP